RTSASKLSRNCSRRGTRSAGRARKPRATGSSSDRFRLSVGAVERRGDHEGQERGRISLDRDLPRGLLDLAPRDPFPNAGPAQTPVPLWGRRDVDGIVEPASELVPPNRVMLRDTTSDHQRARLFRPEDDVGEVRLIPELVDRKLLVLLPKRPQLIPDRPVEDRRHDHRNAVLPGPPQQGLAASRASPELPEEFPRRPRPYAGVPKVAQHGLNLLLQDDAVRSIRNQDVPKAIHPE